MKFNSLYKKNKNGSIQVWHLSADGPDIIANHGKVDGKMQRSVKTVKGKNIGRSNETTAEEQAVLTAQSMWTKKKDKGYFLSIEEAQENIVFLPMLAVPLAKMSEKKKKEIFSDHFGHFVQPKLDGVRCLARWNGDKIQLLSRGGKEYNIPHIAEALESIIKPGQVLDGEIYIHGALRQDINALVKKWRDEEYEDTGYSSKDLEYWVYDSFYMDDLDKRFVKRALDTVCSIPAPYSLVRCVINFHINSEDDLKNHHKYFVDEGFEGTILRLTDGTYELGHRSQSLIKYKDFQDAEYKIIGFKGYDYFVPSADDEEGKFVTCVKWVCDVGNGETVDVVPKGSVEQRIKWFSVAEEYIGQMLTVKFQSLSKDGIPEFPVGLGVRLEEDM